MRTETRIRRTHHRTQTVRLVSMTLVSGPALGMFEVFGRTGP